MLGEILEILGLLEQLPEDEKKIGSEIYKDRRKDSVIQILSAILFLSCMLCLAVYADWKAVGPVSSILLDFVIAIAGTLILSFIFYKLNIFRNISLTTVIYFMLCGFAVCFTSIIILFSGVIN